MHGAKQEPADAADRLSHWREQAAQILKKQELQTKAPKELRDDLQKLGLDTQGRKHELLARLLSATPPAGAAPGNAAVLAEPLPTPPAATPLTTCKP